MQYAEALKKAQEAQKENLLVFRLDYDKHLILPHKAGMAFVESLKNAEIMQSSYSHKVPRIGSFTTETFAMRVMTHNEYIQTKVAQLLNVTLEEVQQKESETT